MDEQVANLSFEGVINNFNAIVQLVNENYSLKTQNKQLLDALRSVEVELEGLKTNGKPRK